MDDMEAYLKKLDLIASAPDSAFPDLLFNHMENDFGDIYYRVTQDDTKNRAMHVDARFTTANIMKLRATTKRVDQYLEWCSLYDDYIEYLVNTYGSLEVVHNMYDLGIFEDPYPQITRRPQLRRKNLRKLLSSGLVPSFYPTGMNEVDIIEWCRKVCDLDPPDIEGEEEPDIMEAYSTKLSRKEKKMLDYASQHYRKLLRMDALVNGSRTSGIWPNGDFVGEYYDSMRRGVYDSEFSKHDERSDLITGMMESYDERHMTETDRMMREAAREMKSHSYFNGFTVKTVGGASEAYVRAIKYLAECGIDAVSMAQSRGKKSVKAVQEICDMNGIERSYSKKELKKLQKKRHRAEDTFRRDKTDSLLAQTLRTNKILMNNGTIRFEDGFRDDDDWY